MGPANSITEKWLPEFKLGAEDAVAAIWEQFFSRIVGEARRRLVGRGVPCRVEDEEDVAISVFRRICEMAAVDNLKRVDRGADLWALLLTITVGKVTDLIRRQLAIKRGRGQVRGESAFKKRDASVGEDSGIQGFAVDDLSPETQVVITEQVDRLLDVLPDATTRAVAERYLQGHKKTEIATELGIGRQAVYRKLDLILSVWRKEVTDEPA